MNPVMPRHSVHKHFWQGSVTPATLYLAGPPGKQGTGIGKGKKKREGSAGGRRREEGEGEEGRSY